MSNLENSPVETVAGAERQYQDAVLTHRNVPLGGVKGVSVNRTLPHRSIPTIGPFCFVDQFGPSSSPGQILPHPHTGLQTVTWLFEGRIHHRDSAGSDVMVAPGQVNLMTAGSGIAHSEYDQTPRQWGFQLWTVMPDAHRNDAPDFEQHSNLPIVERESLTAQVFLGHALGVSSPAEAYTSGLAVDFDLDPGTVEIELDPQFEHGIVFASGSVSIDGTELETGSMQYLAPGRNTVTLSATQASRGIMIGGTPFTEPIVMWWNFIGRTHDEVVAFRERWESQNRDQFFGHVTHHGDERIPAPAMPTVHLKPRLRK